MGNYDYCIRRPYKAPPTNHTNRDYEETMPRLAFCEEGNYPTTPVRVVVRHIESIPADYQPHTDLHYHDRDELFILVSDKEGALEAEVTLGEEVYRVNLPVTVLLPKKVPHNMP